MMRVINYLLVLSLLISVNVEAQLQIDAAYCDNRVNPTGIHPERFFFSWGMGSDGFNQVQTAYQVAIASSEAKLQSGEYDIYDSKKVSSDQSIQVYYAGAPLRSGTSYHWKLRVWDGENKPSGWSESQKFTTGLFAPSDWRQARWIGYENMAEEKRVVPFVHLGMKEGDPRILKNPVAPYLRKTFSISKELSTALLFISGLGHYESSINGAKIGDAFLAPGWTTYDKTILYNTYDISEQLQQGDNTLGVLLGNGFYNMTQERYVKGTGYFGTPKLIMLLKLVYADGCVEYIRSDDSWKTTASPVAFNNMWGGEDYDARLELKGWDTNGFIDTAWKKAILTTIPRGQLLPEVDYPVKLMDTLKVQSKRQINSRITVYDFGQNISGIPAIKIKGKPGQQIKLTPAELVAADGTVYQADGVSPHYYLYTIGSHETESWHPYFTYFAVRYIQVENLSTDGEPTLDQINLLHNRNSSPVNGTFSSADALLNRIQKLIDFAVKSNIQSYITDNPQREKLSWQGEQNFMRTAINYGYNMYGMYRSLIQNMKDAQHANGLIPDIAPEYVQFSGPFVDSPEWGTTGILNMWFLYKFYGDTATIRSSYDMMKRYAGFLESRSEGYLLMYGLGDWLDIGKVTPRGVTASAYYYKAIKAMADMADIIGYTADAECYSRLANDIRTAFNDKFFDKDKSIYASGSQTSLAMPLVLGIVEDRFRKSVLDNLVKQVVEVDSFRLTAGDVGHKFLVRALFENGHSDLLYKITNRDDSPGYGYQLKQGATALVETWDGKMSQNQLAMGHIVDWFYEGLGGIRQAENSVAFKRILIQPQVIEKINAASTSFRSPYGWIKSNWQKKGKRFDIDIEIPVNTTAMLLLPAAGKLVVKINGKSIGPPIIVDGLFKIEFGSGKYKVQINQLK